MLLENGARELRGLSVTNYDVQLIKCALDGVRMPHLKELHLAWCTAVSSRPQEDILGWTWIEDRKTYVREQRGL
jgi:hypothetical protein